MNKKIIIPVIIILIIFITGVVIYQNTQKGMSEKAINALITKGVNLSTNLSCEIITKDNTFEEKKFYARKENCYKIITGNIEISTNWDTNVQISIDKEINEATKDTASTEKETYSQIEYYLDNQQESGFKYVREEVYNNQKCILIELYDKNTNEALSVYWLGKKQGLVQKVENYSKDSEGKLSKLTIEYHNIQVGNVADQDVEANIPSDMKLIDMTQEADY